MSLKYFICPDNQKIEIKDCFAKGGCRMGERCATRSYLQLVSRERPWTGRASTTQLIQGTLQAFLKLTKPYAISPDDRAFMIHGTKSHKNLENQEDEYSVLEQIFNRYYCNVCQKEFDREYTNGKADLKCPHCGSSDIKQIQDTTGMSDVIEVEQGQIIMTDYKTSGSYKVAKAMGFVTVEEPIEGEVFKSGPRKGQQKMRKVLVRRPEAEDRWEWELQLNKYRIEAERRLPEILAKLNINLPGKTKIDEIRIQCCVRDGNTYIARSRGVFRNVYYFKINIMPDEEVLSYFAQKKHALDTALKQKRWTQYCTPKENWDGLKCSRYCEVAEFCPLGQMYKKHKEEEDMPIKNVSDIRRLPRIGKIRLGKKTEKGYPTEVDYFIIDPQTPSELENERIKQEIAKLYGKEPKQLRIMFPMANMDLCFPQWWKRYGQSTMLKCRGDGVEAVCTQPEYAEKLEVIGKIEEGLTKVQCLGKECPYVQAKQCGMRANLQVLLPEIPGAGVWQISTGSFNSIVNMNSCIDYIRTVCGRVHMVPLTLERREQVITHDGKARKHYVLHLNMNFVLADLQKYALIKPERAMITQLPEVEVDKEDIYFQENVEINQAESGNGEPGKQVVDGTAKDPEKIDKTEKDAERDAAFKESTEIATKFSEEAQAAETMKDVNVLAKAIQEHNGTLFPEHKEWLKDELETARKRVKKI